MQGGSFDWCWEVGRREALFVTGVKADKARRNGVDDDALCGSGWTLGLLLFFVAVFSHLHHLLLLGRDGEDNEDEE